MTYHVDLSENTLRITEQYPQYSPVMEIYVYSIADANGKSKSLTCAFVCRFFTEAASAFAWLMVILASVAFIRAILHQKVLHRPK